MKYFFALCFIALCSNSFAWYKRDPETLRRSKIVLERLLNLKPDRSRNPRLIVDKVTAADAKMFEGKFRIKAKLEQLDISYINCTVTLEIESGNPDYYYRECVFICDNGVEFEQYYTVKQLQEILADSKLNLY